MKIKFESYFFNVILTKKNYLTESTGSCFSQNAFLITLHVRWSLSNSVQLIFTIIDSFSRTKYFVNYKNNIHFIALNVNYMQGFWGLWVYKIILRQITSIKNQDVWGINNFANFWRMLVFLTVLWLVILSLGISFVTTSDEI